MEIRLDVRGIDELVASLLGTDKKDSYERFTRTSHYMGATMTEQGGSPNDAIQFLECIAKALGKEHGTVDPTHDMGESRVLYASITKLKEHMRALEERGLEASTEFVKSTDISDDDYIAFAGIAYYLAVKSIGDQDGNSEAVKLLSYASNAMDRVVDRLPADSKVRIFNRIENVQASLGSAAMDIEGLKRLFSKK